MMTGYELSRAWFNFAFDNPDKVKPIHCAIFFFAIEHQNRLGGKEKFGFPSQMTMDAIGVKKYQTYGKALNELEEWGFITFVERSKNQYSANIISINAIPKKSIARGKALDKATIKHGSKQGHSTGQGKDSIDKPINQEPIKPTNQERGTRPHDIGELIDYFFEKIQEQESAKIEAQKFWDHYESNGWKVGGKSPMKDWKAAVRQWIGRMGDFSKKSDTGIPHKPDSVWEKNCKDVQLLNQAWKLWRSNGWKKVKIPNSNFTKWEKAS